ncbi:MAG: hypothetical protein ACO1SX_10840 [Actinomycetota bacterium]
MAVALPIAIWVTARATRALYSGDISKNESRAPHWLETMLPVRGRWLRYLMWGPVYLPMIVAMFLSQLLTWSCIAVWVIKSLPFGR